ncbi:glycosyltransferase family 4 protein [Patescibacteria group bacterium]
MRVAIDTGPLSGGHAVRGIGVMVREEIAAIEKVCKNDKSISIHPVDFSSKDLSKYDLVHYPYFFPFKLTLPSKREGKRSIVTIQDLIHLIYPDKYPSGTRGKINLIKQKQRLKNIDKIVTISETSKKDIVRFLGVNADTVEVVHLAPRRVFKPIKDSKKLGDIKKKYKLPDKFILFVGDINYNKNVITLIKACKKLKYTLVIVGKQALELEKLGSSLQDIHGPRDWIRFLRNEPHPELAHFQELLVEIKEADVMRLGFVPDNDLVTIFSLSRVYCQPSFYEGFGLPILEAMACGTPVVAGRNQAHKEVAGNGCLYANPKSYIDMAKSIKILCESGKVRSDVISKADKIVSEYSWDKTAREMIKVYKSVS